MGIIRRILGKARRYGLGGDLVRTLGSLKGLARPSGDTLLTGDVNVHLVKNGDDYLVTLEVNEANVIGGNVIWVPLPMSEVQSLREMLTVATREATS